MVLTIIKIPGVSKNINQAHVVVDGNFIHHIDNQLFKGTNIKE